MADYWDKYRVKDECPQCRGSGLNTVDSTTAAGSHANRCPRCLGKGRIDLAEKLQAHGTGLKS